MTCHGDFRRGQDAGACGLLCPALAISARHRGSSPTTSPGSPDGLSTIYCAFPVGWPIAKSVSGSFGHLWPNRPACAPHWRMQTANLSNGPDQTDLSAWPSDLNKVFAAQMTMGNRRGGAQKAKNAWPIDIAASLGIESGAIRAAELLCSRPRRTSHAFHSAPRYVPCHSWTRRL